MQNVASQVQFNGSSSYDQNVPIVSYEWDFGMAQQVTGGCAQIMHTPHSGGTVSHYLRIYAHNLRSQMIACYEHPSQQVMRMGLQG